MRTSARAGEAKRAFVATAWRSSGRLSARTWTPPGSSTRSASATWHSRIPRVIRIAGDKSRSIARCQAREDDGSEPDARTAPCARAGARRPAGDRDGLARLSSRPRPAARARGDAGAARAAAGGRARVLLVPRTGGWRRHEEPGQRGRDGARIHGAHADDVREDDRRSPRVRARRRAAPQARRSRLPREDGGGGAPHAGLPELRERAAGRRSGRLPARRLGADPPRRGARGARRRDRARPRLLRLPRAARRRGRREPGLVQGLRARLLGRRFRRPGARRRRATDLDREGRARARRRAPDRRPLLQAPGDQDAGLRALRPRSGRGCARRLRALDPCRELAAAHSIVKLTREAERESAHAWPRFQLFGAPSAIQERIVKVSPGVRQPPAGGKPGQPSGITAPPRGRPWPRIRCASWLPLMLPGFTRSSLPVVARALTLSAYATPISRLCPPLRFW